MSDHDTSTDQKTTTGRPGSPSARQGPSARSVRTDDGFAVRLAAATTVQRRRTRHWPSPRAPCSRRSGPVPTTRSSTSTESRATAVGRPRGLCVPPQGARAPPSRAPRESRDSRHDRHHHPHRNRRDRPGPCVTHLGPLDHELPARLVAAALRPRQERVGRRRDELVHRHGLPAARRQRPAASRQGRARRRHRAAPRPRVGERRPQRHDGRGRRRRDRPRPRLGHDRVHPGRARRRRCQRRRRPGGTIRPRRPTGGSARRRRRRRRRPRRLALPTAEGGAPSAATECRAPDAVGADLGRRPTHRRPIEGVAPF